MYKFLKMLQPVAEQIGDIHNVKVESNSRYFGDRVQIKGTVSDGRTFELELTIKEEKGDDDGRN